MLSYLRIRGLALLDDVVLEFSRGMNVLTGETGAGKSIIVEALALLRGARAQTTALRAGVDAIRVDGQFEISGRLVERIDATLGTAGLTLDEGNLLVQRIVPRAGRGRCLVQSEMTTQAVLTRLGEGLLDICSQHEHHSLTHVARHLELLDGYARIDPALDDYARRFQQYRATRAELEALRSKQGEAAGRADYLRFQLEELERIAPQPGEYEALRGRLELLRDAKRWGDLAREAQEVLYESEDSVVARLASLEDRARRGASHSTRLAAVAEHLTAAVAAAEEAAREAMRFWHELELEPAQLETAEDRFSELSALRRKYGSSLDDITEHLASMQSELDLLDHAEEHLTELERRLQTEHADCVQRALELRRRRQATRAKLAREVVDELAALHIPGALFEIAWERLDEADLGPRGLDRIQFLFSANPGEPPAPLSRVASGGELSRVLLAVKGVLSTGDQVATYVFDEVDAGVGGAVAQAIGQRLSRAAREHQVLCITHLPQIAAFADTHFRVEKRTTGGRTTARVVRLSVEERVEELARMLGGARVTQTARTHAVQLLEEAAAARSVNPKPAPTSRKRRAR